MRIIDGKYHIVDEQIIKSSNGEPIPEDEPTFIFRGRDHLALFLLQHYRVQCEQDGCSDYQINLLDEQIERFRKFREEHPDRLKQPGCTQGK